MMALESLAADLAFLVGRVAFGGVLAFMGLNHFLQTDAMTGYAQAKGLPAPRVGVLASGGLLVGAGAAIVLGAFPTLAAGGLALFRGLSALLFHDFWAVPEDQKQDEMTAFLKNVGLVGGALLFFALGSSAWPYAVGVGVF
jgi:uncharacterized membrane protein YphA (DoxX/SURF4 family)